jgi:predicted hydrocarbon binding protein
MAYEITGRTVCTVLRAVREVTGALYPQLLAQAGWTRFLDNLPPNDFVPVATRTELESLFGGAYALMGEAPTRLFLRNYGSLLGQQVMSAPAGQELQAALPSVPPAEHLRWMVERLLDISNRSWTETTMSEDDRAYYLTYKRCPLCAQISHAQAPLCTTMTTFYGSMVRALLGSRTLIVETQCAAIGDPACVVAFYKTAPAGA